MDRNVELHHTILGIVLYTALISISHNVITLSLNAGR